MTKLLALYIISSFRQMIDSLSLILSDNTIINVPKTSLTISQLTENDVQKIITFYVLSNLDMAQHKDKTINSIKIINSNSDTIYIISLNYKITKDDIVLRLNFVAGFQYL